MNAKLQRKLTNKIAGLFDPFVNRESDIIDQNNVRSMLKYLTSVDIQWWRIWSNVSNEICQYQNQSVKNENFSNSLYSFALFRFSQIKNYTDETENHIKLKQERESILSLIDRAIVHCEIVDRLAPMFMLRSMVLNELNGDIISALYNIEESIKLASDKPIYHIYKAAILVHDGQLVSSLRLLDSLLSNICTVSTEHSAQLLQMIRTEIKQLKCRFNMNQDKLSQPKECRSNFGPDFIELDSRCILMSNSAPTGQRLVANKNIPDGTTILTESSYMMLNGDKNQLMNRCRYCQRNVTHRFWPCSKCTSVVYCDRSCLRQDWNHLTECGIVDLWYENNKNYKYIQYAFRIFNQIGIETLLDLPDSVESFPYEDYLHDVDSERIRLNAFVSLQNHCTMITLEDIQRQLISAIDCTMISLFVQGYDIVDVTTNQLHKLISHAYRIEQRVSINLFRLIDQNHSTAMYLMGSMFNHSCNPNLSWSIDDNGILRVITCMPIDSGHDLTINYKPIEISMSFEQRQIQCRQRFFQCNCEICFHQVRNFVSLQCIKCSGPVVVNSVVFDRYQCPSIDSPRCLQCGEPEIDATHKLRRLETLRTTLHFGSQLLTITKDKKDKYIEMLSNIYREIESICYNHSYDLIEDIYAICVALHREGRIDQCVPFGLKVDNLLSFDSDDWSSMPLNNVNSIRGLPKNEVATNFNRNIDHMLFWTHSIFQTVIDREPALKNIYYNTLQRFQRRTIEVIIRSIEQSKSKRLMSKQQLTTIELDEEIKLLEVLLEHERSQFVESNNS